MIAFIPDPFRFLLSWLRGKERQGASQEKGVRMDGAGLRIAGLDIGFGHQPRAPWACDPARSRGRALAEPPSPTRTDFQRDRDRIIHSTAFRRLKHKTQVFVEHEGDHFRTRLTHTLEVAQIARGLARALRLDEDLTEAIALVHDFGHTPFGHAGERALNACLSAQGGFDHNAQALKIVTELEHIYASHDGLNLTFETLEGLVKHNGPLTGPHARHAGVTVPDAILAADGRLGLGLDLHAPLEAQCAAIADDIAYDAHDIDDGMRSGILSMEALSDAPVIGPIVAEVRARFPGLADARLIHEMTRRQITMMVEDVLAQAGAWISAERPANPDDVRRAGRTVVSFGAALQAEEAALKAFMYERLYRHPAVMAKMNAAQDIVTDLFGRYCRSPAELGDASVAAAKAPLERIVADYIAGMTDRFAIREHRRLFDRTPDLG
jgi:dGTPase